MPKASAAQLRLSHLPKGSAATYEPADDPAPDVFGVTWTGDRVIVRHYRHRCATKPCCQAEGVITDADRAAANDVVSVEGACLQRLRMPCGVDA